MSKMTAARKPGQARERLVRAAYNLFTKKGINPVGIDAILAKSGCAKASLYANFKSKDDLALAYLDMREEIWTRGWLETEIHRRAASPEARLLAIFDIYDEWFQRKSFEGCVFVNVLLEMRADGRMREAAGDHLAKLRSIVESLAREAGLPRPKDLARVWNVLMKGAVISACEGDRDAALTAKWMAQLALQSWGGNGAYVRRPPAGTTAGMPRYR
jgi:AcrR family transcriptional regulator